MKKLTRILLVVLTLTIVATSVASCEFTDKITSWIDKVYDYIVTGCVHEGGAATCTEKAICSLCGQPYGKPLGHTPEAIPGVEPSCTESGITEGSRCAVCGEILESQKPLSPLGHSFGEWEVTTPATCTTDGERKSTCSTCGETHTEIIKANGHTEVVDTGKPATCTENGLTDGKHCSVCNTVIVAQQTIPKTQHEYEKEVTAPKCLEQGYTTYTCKHCGDTYTSDYKKPTGHTFGEWEVTTPATCTAEGVQSRSCTHKGCKATETMPVGAKGHNYVKNTGLSKTANCTEAGYDYYKCTGCDDHYTTNYTPAKGHSFTGSNKKCDNCDYERGCQHTNKETITGTPATCTTTGLTAGEKCKDCGEIITAQTTIPALGHDFKSTGGKVVTNPTCTEAGYTTYTCQRTGCTHSYKSDYTSATGHDWGDWSTKTPATCTTDGEETRTCGNCSATDTRTIGASGHDCEKDATLSKAPTCTEVGYDYYKCKNCDHNYKDNYQQPLGHKVVWTQTKAPTCTEEGTITGVCTREGCTESTGLSATVAALGHKGGTATCKTQATCTVCGNKYGELNSSNHEGTVDTTTWYHDATNHWNQYTCCGAHANETAHSVGEHGTAAGCETNAVCGTCGRQFGEPNGHTPVDGLHDDGEGKHYQECENCDKHLNATAHIYAETWSKDGTNHWHECECGAKKDVTAHSYTNGLCLCGALQPKTLRIETKADLLAFRDAVNGGNTYVGYTIYLINDIDLDGIDFGGIGNTTINGWGPNTSFGGTFMGLDHTVSNFTISAFDDPEGNDTAGFFNSVSDSAEIHNLTISNATINSTHYAGGIVGYANCVIITNSKVTNVTLTSTPQKKADGTYDNGDKVGGIIGYASGGGNIWQCEVSKVTIKGYRDIGGIAGCVELINILQCHVDNTEDGKVKIEVNGAHDYKNNGTVQSKYNAGNFVGRNNLIGNGNINQCTGSAEITYINLACKHTNKETITGTPATCTDSGLTDGEKCKDCGEILTEQTTIPALGHSYDKSTGWIAEVPATCTNEGTLGHYHCTRCNEDFDADDKELESLTINKLNHTYDQKVATSDHLASSATCEAKAKYYYSCTCGANGTNTFEYGDYAAHTVGTWVDEIPAKCDVTGTKGHYVCSVCGKNLDSDKTTVLDSLTIDKDPTNHSGTLGSATGVEGGYASDAEGHWQVWSCCGVTTTKTAHDYGTTGSCVCGRVSHVHSFGDWIDEVPATCVATGTKAHKTCSGCGKHFDDKDNEITDLDIAIDTDAHTLVAVSGVTGLFHCDGCGKDFKLDSSKTSWKLLTDVSKLTAGSKIIIVAADSDCALSTTQNDNNRGQAAITKNSDGTVTISDSVQIITVETGNKDGTFAFNVGSGYLYAASSSKNYLKTETNLSNNSSWLIDVTSKGVATIKAQGSNTRNLLRHNSGSKIFSCYSSSQNSQEDVSIYIQILGYTEVAEHVCADNVTGATCTADGTCSVCGRTVENSKTPHVYVDHFCTCGAEQPKMYLATSANWREAGAWFAAYFWSSTGQAWEKMTDDDLDGVYECYIPEGMTQVIILRKNPENKNFDFDGEWGRVSDQTLPTNGNNCYKVINWNDEGSGWITFNGGIWVVGTINATDPWDIGDDRLMTFDSTTNLWTLVYNNVAAGTYEIKSKDSIDNWYGTADGNNISVTVPGDHSKVTVTFSISDGVNVSVEAHVHDWTWVTTDTTHKQTCLCEDVQNEGSHSYTNGLCICGAIDPNYYFPKNISDLGTLDDGTQVEFTGTVVEIDYAWKNNCMSVYVADSEGNRFYIYKLATQVALCDVITVKGEIDTYNSSKQIASGATATIAATKGHDWADATCSLPKTCKVCGATDGDALGHNYVDGVCSTCGEEENPATKYTYTFTEKVFDANNQSKKLGTISWTLAGDGGYWGNDKNKGQQFGSKSSPYKTLTLTSDTEVNKVTKIVVNACMGSSGDETNMTVTVGGVQIGSTVNIKSATTATDFTFTSEEPLSGEVVITITQTNSNKLKALYIKTISINQ